MRLEALLGKLRTVPGLIERSPGVFYRKSGAFLHFHEDPAGIFADVKLDGSCFERLPASTPAEQAVLLEAITAVTVRPSR